jgi:flavin-dependent dehydrogenase
MLTTDVCIVGGGPGGLTAAHAVRAAAPHLKVCVRL